MLEDVAREHGAHPESQPVVDSDRRAVIHHPKPYERFALGIFRHILIAVILGLERGIARIETVHHRALRRRVIRGWRVIRPAKIEFVQRVTHHDAAMLHVAVGELMVKAFDPRHEGFFGVGQGMQVAIFVARHNGLT